ncbi:hypothetical protein PAMP_001256 [Pampus punctatissimus]
MAAVGELVLVLGLLVSANCEVRARDPEVEKDEEEQRGRTAVGGVPPHLQNLHPEATEPPLLGESGNYPPRSGNWCPFMQKRVVTMAVVCGTEPYVVKSESPCPSGEPNCRLVIRRRSTTIYCGAAVRDTEEKTVRIQTQVGQEKHCHYRGNYACFVKPEQRQRGLHTRLQEQHDDPNQEQNDNQASSSVLHKASYPDNNQHNTSTHPTQDPDHAHSPEPGHAHTPHHKSLHTADTSHHDHHHLHHDHRQQAHPLPYEVDAALLYPDVPAVLPVPHMMALVMSQLQPFLQGFNRSLEHLSQQVGELARDVAQLKSSQLAEELQAEELQAEELQAEPLGGPEVDEAAVERLDARLDTVFQHINEVRRQMESQRTDTEERLHSQHVMLYYNLTTFKTDVDMKLKRHQKMLQVSLQAMNASLSELMLDQDQMTHLSPPSLPQPSHDSALWEAIERLDNMVVNNTVKVSGLMEDVEVTSGSVQQLRRDIKELDKQINQTARNSQIQFMETGLEVESAKMVVLGQVSELAGNLSKQGKRLHELDVDLDDLYNVINSHNPFTDCSCATLKATITQLEEGVANVTELANENRALYESGNEGAGQWVGDNNWEPAVGVLQGDLQQVKESLTSEQTRTRTLEQSLIQLSSSVSVTKTKVSDLNERNKKVEAEMSRLSSFFNSLLKDTIRHSDVLELLLGEEPLDFLEWSTQDQETHSILAIKEQLTLLQEQMSVHDQSITSLLDNRPGGKEEVPSADQPSSSHLLPDWLSGSMRRSSGGAPTREHQLLHHPGGDGSDLWNLEKTVEELGLKVLRLEEKPCPTTCNNTTEREVPSSGVEAKLQEEVMWLKRGLEEHLRVFKNVFSNADVLARSDATLELDRLWQLVKNKDRKKEKKRGGAREGSERGNHRNRRDSTGVPVLSGLSDGSLLFIAGSPRSVSDGDIVFEASLNRGQFHADTGAFTVPVDGIYLFVLTLDMRPGPAHISLRRGEAQVSLQRRQVTEARLVTTVSLLLLKEGEELRPHLSEGAWAESEYNVFTGLLLHRTT